MYFPSFGKTCFRATLLFSDFSLKTLFLTFREFSETAKTDFYSENYKIDLLKLMKLSVKKDFVKKFCPNKNLISCATLKCTID